MNLGAELEFTLNALQGSDELDPLQAIVNELLGETANVPATPPSPLTPSAYSWGEFHFPPIAPLPPTLTPGPCPYPPPAASSSRTRPDELWCTPNPPRIPTASPAPCLHLPPPLLPPTVQSNTHHGSLPAPLPSTVSAVPCTRLPPPPLHPSVPFDIWRYPYPSLTPSTPNIQAEPCLLPTPKRRRRKKMNLKEQRTQRNTEVQHLNELTRAPIQCCPHPKFTNDIVPEKPHSDQQYHTCVPGPNNTFGNLVPVGTINGEVVYSLPPEAFNTIFPSASPVDHLKRRRHRQPEDGLPYIKKPPNAFMLFMKEQRPNVVAELKVTDNAVVNTVIGQRWRLLLQSVKDKYFCEADKLRHLHEQQFPDWSARENYGRRRRIRTRKSKSQEALLSRVTTGCYSNSI